MKTILCPFCKGTFVLSTQNNIDGKLGYIIPDFNKMFFDFYFGQNIFILGGRGSGKSNLMAWFYGNTDKRSIFWNVTRKPQIRLMSDFELSITKLSQLSEVLNYPQYNKIHIDIPRQAIGNDKFMFEKWDELNEILWKHEDKIFSNYMEKTLHLKKGIDFEPRSNIVVFNDEMMSVTMEGKRIPPNFKASLYAGGNTGLSFVYGSQRHQTIPKLATTMSDWKIMLRCDEYDIDALKNKIGHVDKILNLKPYHFIVYKPVQNQLDFYLPVDLYLENRNIQTVI